MICLTINIYSGTPVRSWFTKNNREIIFPWAIFHFIPKLSFTGFPSIIGADGVKSILC